MAVQGKARTGGWMLLLVLAAIALAALTQHALANSVARFLADLWVSTMAVVLKLFGSIFGAH